MRMIMVKSLFRKSWHFTWQNPFLWLFGFFAIPLISNEFGLILINLERIARWTKNLFIFRDFQPKEILAGFGLTFPLNTSSIFNLSLTIVIGLIFLYLAYLAQITLFLKTKSPESNLSWEKVVSQSKNFFFRIVVINISALAASSCLLFFLSLGLVKGFASSGRVFHLSPLILLILLFLIIGIFISFLARFAICAVILEEKGLAASIKRAVSFFFKNWRGALKISLLIFLLGALAGISFLLISLGTALPFVLLVNIFLRFNLSFAFWLTVGFWTVLLAVVFLVLGTLYSSWQFLVWGFFFKEDNLLKSLGVFYT